LLLERSPHRRIVFMSMRSESMRFHLDSAQRESRICIGAVVAIMILTGSAIFIMGAHFYMPNKAMDRVVLASPF